MPDADTMPWMAQVRRAVALPASMAPSFLMTEPAAPAPTLPAVPPLPEKAGMTHPCARCGAPVPLDVGLCERCNPLGLKDSASSQVHGTVFLAIGLAVLGLAVAARIAVTGIGPFTATTTQMQAGTVAGSIVATIQVTNQGTAQGSATCRITDPNDRGAVHSDVVYTQRIEPGQTVTFDHETDFGSVDRPFNVACQGP
jgi:hypothetical protein